MVKFKSRIKGSKDFRIHIPHEVMEEGDFRGSDVVAVEMAKEEEE